jgi:hypothetical protein
MGESLVPLNLRKLRAPIVEGIARELERTEIYGNVVISTWSMRDLSKLDGLVSKGQLGADLFTHLGDEPISTFVIRELKRMFVGGEWDLEAHSRLVDWPGFEDLEQVAAKLIAALESLPWTYVMTVRLPGSLTGPFSERFKTFELTPRHRIVNGDQLGGEFPLDVQEQGLQALYRSTSWDPAATYLQVTSSGYLASSATESFHRTRDEIHAFFGLGIALGLFDPFVDRYGDERDSGQWRYVVHEGKGNGWQQIGVHDLDDQHARKLAGLRVNKFGEGSSDSLAAVLGRIGAVFRSEHGRKVELAARWLFESYCSRDVLQEFIQATVALEILLGDEAQPEGVGLTTLMANRCAYAIGRTPEHRETLIKDFREIYRIRSKIVHTGKTRLSSEERRYLFSLRSICAIVIKREFELVHRGDEVAARRAAAAGS